MRILKCMIIILLLLTGAPQLHAQIEMRSSPAAKQVEKNRERQRLGIQYYQNREFEKALEIFTALYDEDPSHINYTYYLYALTELQQYREAEKLIRKHSRKNPGSLRYEVDLGFIYLSAGEPDKARETFGKAIESLPANPHEIRQIANAFYFRNQPEYAILTYLKGKELLAGTYTFDIELATMYERNGNYPEMVETLLDYLAETPDAMEEVQNKLQSAMAQDIEQILPGILRENLLIRYQASPEEVYLNELLLWLSVQQRDFSFAFVQARSLDRRFNEDGYRVLDVADLALANKDFNAALEAYEYVLGKGRQSPLYLNGLIGFLETRYQQLANNIKIEPAGMQELESAYIEAVDEFGVHNESIQLLRDLAHIQAFYLGKEEEAIENLNLALEVPGPETLQRAMCKLELADIYLYTGEVWEATLLYSQVEKTFKNEPIGHLAKLKNARLTYYIGEFAWAKAQLDVLKAATSKLIANDALELSLLIADNVEIDSTYAGLRLYAKAELLLYRNMLEASLETLDSINLLAAWHPLHDEVLFREAEIREKQGLFHQADSLLERITRNYGDDILGDDALYKRARMHEEVFGDPEKARELYRELLTRYPGSVYTMEVRRKFRELRGDEL